MCTLTLQQHWFPSSQVTPQSFHRCSLILMAGRQHSSKAALSNKQPTSLKPPEKKKQSQECSFECHGREPGHSSHSHPTRSHFVEFSSQCKWFGHQQLPVQHIQVTVGTPLSPPRSGNFRADIWQLLRFQFEEREIKQPPAQHKVFLHREHHISCNISSSHGALMTSLPEQQGSPRSLPALTTCQAASTSHALLFSSGSAAHLFFTLLSFLLLPCIKTQISQIRLAYIWVK